VPDRARAWRGDSPHQQIDRQLRTASAKSYTDLRAAHIADYQRLFHRVSLRLASGAPDLPTDERLVRYRDGASDTALEALFFQYGRYLLISSSRPGSRCARGIVGVIPEPWRLAGDCRGARKRSGDSGRTGRTAPPGLYPMRRRDSGRGVHRWADRARRDASRSDTR